MKVSDRRITLLLIFFTHLAEKKNRRHFYIPFSGSLNIASRSWCKLYDCPITIKRTDFFEKKSVTSLTLASAKLALAVVRRQ
jgi:hypothetical protein